MSTREAQTPTNGENLSRTSYRKYSNYSVETNPHSTKKQTTTDVFLYSNDLSNPVDKHRQDRNNKQKGDILIWISPFR